MAEKEKSKDARRAQPHNLSAREMPRKPGGGGRDEAAPPSASCSCFSLCSEADARRFHLRLPVAESAASPWAAYLGNVYGGAVPLPVDLKRLALFYVSLLPADSCIEEQKPPPCRDCAGWLEAEDPVRVYDEWQHEQAFVAHSLYPRTRMQMLWFEPMQATMQTGWFASASRRGGPPLEVIRLPPMPARTDCLDGDGAQMLEGVRGAGCWFYEAAGSGVFVQPGPRQAYSSRVMAYREMRPGLGVSQAVDCHFANAARRGGWHAVQIKSELVIANDACMHGAHAVSGACPPPSLPISSGWQGGAPCRCADGFGTINCAASARASMGPQRIYQLAPNASSTWAMWHLAWADTLFSGAPNRCTRLSSWRGCNEFVRGRYCWRRQCSERTGSSAMYVKVAGCGRYGRRLSRWPIDQCVNTKQAQLHPPNATVSSAGSSIGWKPRGVASWLEQRHLNSHQLGTLRSVPARKRQSRRITEAKTRPF